MWIGGKYTSVDAFYYILISNDGCMLFFNPTGDIDKNLFIPRPFVAMVISYSRNDDNMSIWRGKKHVHDWIYNCLGKELPEGEQEQPLGPIANGIVD